MLNTKSFETASQQAAAKLDPDLLNTFSPLIFLKDNKSDIILPLTECHCREPPAKLVHVTSGISHAPLIVNAWL